MNNIVFGYEAMSHVLRRLKRTKVYFAKDPQLDDVRNMILRQEPRPDIRTIFSIDQLDYVVNTNVSSRSGSCLFLSYNWLYNLVFLKRKVFFGAITVVMFTDSIELEMVDFAKLYSFAVWFAKRPRDIYSMIIDANVYSKRRRIPSIVFIPRNLLLSFEPMTFRGFDATWEAMLGRTKTMHGGEKETCQAIGLAADVLGMVTQNRDEYAFEEIHALIPGRVTANRDRLVIDKRNIDFRRYETEVMTQFSQYLPKNLKEHIGNLYNVVDFHIEPGLDRPTRQMCPGCPARIEISNILGMPNRKTICAEEFYCRSIHCHVVTGIKDKNVDFASDRFELQVIAQEHRDRRAVFFTDEETGPLENIEVHRIALRCGEYGKTPVRIITTKCDGCGDCLNLTGCPALDIKQKVAVVDSRKCVNCGLCTRICRRGAIC